ncbi:MAG: NAD(P)-dependent oxidoreductase [Solirubrobacteraceae bacterium]
MTQPAAAQNDGGGSLPRVGVVGAGSIGASVASRLAGLGARVSAFDLDAGRVRALAQAGVVEAGTARQLAEDAEIVILALPDSPHVLACMEGRDGLEAGLASGSCVLLMSTVKPDTARALAARLAERGVELLDTPVSGGPVAGRDGTLAIMVGGSDAGFARCRALLECLGGNVVHVGPVGDGETTKLVNNLMGAVIVLGIAEGLALAAKAGIDVERARQAIAGGSGGSWILSEWVPRTVLADPSQTHFAVELMCKDMGLVRDLAESLGVPLEAGALAERTFAALRDAGDGGRDFSVLMTRRAEAAGTSLPATGRSS